MFKSHRGQRFFFDLSHFLKFLGLVSPGDSEDFPSSSTRNNTIEIIISTLHGCYAAHTVTVIFAFVYYHVATLIPKFARPAPGWPRNLAGRAPVI